VLRDASSLAGEPGLGVKCRGGNTSANKFRTWRDPREPFPWTPRQCRW